jgi:quercetin dioxygenase-like cupin family protein
MEATYGGTGALPPAHFHPHQHERFEVLEGEIRAVLDGVERRYLAGESFEVPVGTPHQMTADVPARVRWVIAPAMRTAEFFERLYGDGPDSLRGGSDLFEEFREEFRLAGT